MPAHPQVTVVIPTRDRAALVGRAVDSVLAQTATAFELLVVDDGSSDDTVARLRTQGDPRMHVLAEPARGVCAARNAGARRARATLLTFLDSDDVASPYWLERLTAPLLASPAVGVSCCGYRAVAPQGALETVLPAAQGAVFEHQPGPYLAGTFACRRELFLAAGGYDESLVFSENTELAMRLIPLCLERGLATAAVAEPLVEVHRPATPRRLDAGGLGGSLASSERILERHHRRLARDGRVHALLLATAGVRAARLGQLARARAHFRRALLANPLHWRHAARLLLACLPGMAARVWGSAARTSGG